MENEIIKHQYFCNHFDEFVEKSLKNMLEAHNINEMRFKETDIFSSLDTKKLIVKRIKESLNKHGFNLNFEVFFGINKFKFITSEFQTTPIIHSDIHIDGESFYCNGELRMVVKLKYDTYSNMCSSKDLFTAVFNKSNDFSIKYYL